ncbi:hypothetical protein HRJ34_15550 [Rhizorhabdus wittichii]|uniref:Uncharacterized protein n=1 Tax=Rhizorhabdus wittichii TaxID=160791 RepID=A0A975CYS6_9SPHN|nr:hypothetical protein [Rhizorhabdus wittichii]QTH19779.1 hypothetical protein HRJ34_15550 [Rhizorhabdus wittichii]
MTPIERAARALWELDTSSANPGVSFNPLHEQSDETKQRYAERVRAVLTAIREPSVKMASLGREEWACATDTGEYETDAEVMMLSWKAMIDAALAEGV